MIDATDRRLIDALWGGFPISDRPYEDVGATLGLSEDDVIGRIDALIREGTLSRFGPLFNVERLGGAFVLAAMAVPSERFDVVAETVNSFPEVAHNYARDHELNMWFVLAAERPERVDEVIEEIEQATGLPVYAFPKLEEFYVGLRLSA